MPTLGEILRQERQKQNRTLAEIASATCISSRYLQAIENSAYDELPGGMFAKSFIKQYCSALGVDPASVESEINEAVPSPVEDPLPALSENYQVPRISGSGNGIKTSWLVVLLVAAIGGSAGFYAWWQKLQHRTAIASSEESSSVQAASGTPPTAAAPAPVQEAPKPVESSPVAAAPSPSAEPVQVAQVDPNKLTLNLEARERTWVSLSADGRTLFSGVLDVSERKEIDGLENAKLVTGNAAGLDVRWNGKPLGPLGNRGQVRTIIFTPQKYEFVVPVPKKPASDSPGVG